MSGTAVIHIRDFINEVGADPSKPDQTTGMQIKASLNIPAPPTLEISDGLEPRSIPASIRFFCPPIQTSSYERNVFIYAWGPFYFLRTDQERELIINAYTVQCHPGFETSAKLDRYNDHCPEAAPPSIVLIATVLGRPQGRLNDAPTLLSYPMEATVYSASTRAQITFPIRVFLKNGKRWVKFPPLNPRAAMVVIGRLCGFMKADQTLAIMADDMNFLGSSKIEADPPQAPDPQSKHPASDRWS